MQKSQKNKFERRCWFFFQNVNTSQICQPPQAVWEEVVEPELGSCQLRAAKRSKVFSCFMWSLVITWFCASWQSLGVATRIQPQDWALGTGGSRSKASTLSSLAVDPMTTCALCIPVPYIWDVQNPHKKKLPSISLLWTANFEKLNLSHYPQHLCCQTVMFDKVWSVLDVAAWAGLAGVSQCSGQKPFGSHDEGSPPQELEQQKVGTECDELDWGGWVATWSMWKDLAAVHRAHHWCCFTGRSSDIVAMQIGIFHQIERYNISNVCV